MRKIVGLRLLISVAPFFLFSCTMKPVGSTQTVVVSASSVTVGDTVNVGLSINGETQNDPERQKPILFRRIAGSVRVTLFEGGHDQETRAGLDWLSRQRKGRLPDFGVSAVPAPNKPSVGTGNQAVAP